MSLEIPACGPTLLRQEGIYIADNIVSYEDLYVILREVKSGKIKSLYILKDKAQKVELMLINNRVKYQGPKTPGKKSYARHYFCYEFGENM